MVPKRFFIVIFALLSLWTTAANADSYFEDEDWIIKRNTDERNCSAAQRQKQSGIIALIATNESLKLSIIDLKLSWISDGRTYPAIVLIDKSRWTGNLEASHLAGAGNLTLASASREFVEAFVAGSRMAVIVDGTQYGPYPLTGTRNLVSMMGDCVRPLEPSESPAPEQSKTQQESLPEGYTLEWAASDIGKTFASGDIVVSLTSRKKPDDTTAVIVDVFSKTSGSAVSFEIEGSFRPSGRLGLVALGTTNEAQQLYFSNYTGGVHCCTEVRVIDFTDKKTRLVKIGAFDAGEIEPADEDGDGIMEIVGTDERFRAFDAYAGTFPPYRIWRVIDGEAKDITRDASFAHLHEKLYRRQARVCEYSDRHEYGACAGLLGTASILGVLPATVEFVALERSNTTETFLATLCEDENCTKTRDFTSFKEGIVYALEKWGYQPPPADDDFVKAMRSLTDHKYGDATPNSEMGCNVVPTTITEKTGVLGSTIFVVQGFESSCAVSSGHTFGTTLLMQLACIAEGSPPELQSRVLSMQGDAFVEGSFSQIGVGSSYSTQYTRCPADHAR